MDDNSAKLISHQSTSERRDVGHASDQQYSAPNTRLLAVALESVSCATPDTQAGYFAEFDKFCRCYPGREERLSAVLAEPVFAQAKAGNRSLRILDVGSADGRLLRALLKRLPVTPASITCLEPCQEGFRRLQESMQGLTAQVNLYAKTLEAWLSAESTTLESFDLIICSHVYYHFENPAAITRRLAQLLSPWGALVAIIDSHDSPLYNWLDTEPVTSTTGPISRYGGYFGFEQLRTALEDCAVPHTAGVIDSKLAFHAASDFFHAVAFLGRRTAVDGTIEVHRPSWAQTFPCQIDWREGFVVMRGAQ
jgi:SAM-dependent methyltransferase